MTVSERCKHERLTFGSGGFYIFCRDCMASWVARKRENDEIDYSRSSEGLSTGDCRDKLDGVKSDREAFLFALKALFEWYDRDGSVGAASIIFDAYRSLTHGDGEAKR